TEILRTQNRQCMRCLRLNEIVRQHGVEELALEFCSVLVQNEHGALQVVSDLGDVLTFKERFQFSDNFSSIGNGDGNKMRFVRFPGEREALQAEIEVRRIVGDAFNGDELLLT